MNPAQSERRGILAGGNWIVDRPMIIDVYPVQDSLANILRETSICTYDEMSGGNFSTRKLSVLNGERVFRRRAISVGDWAVRDIGLFR